MCECKCLKQPLYALFPWNGPRPYSNHITSARHIGTDGVSDVPGTPPCSARVCACPLISLPFRVLVHRPAHPSHPAPSEQAHGSLPFVYGGMWAHFFPLHHPLQSIASQMQLPILQGSVRKGEGCMGPSLPTVPLVPATRSSRTYHMPP